MGLKIFETIVLISLLSLAMTFPVEKLQHMTLLNKLSYISCASFIGLGLCFAITLIYG